MWRFSAKWHFYTNNSWRSQTFSVRTWTRISHAKHSSDVTIQSKTESIIYRDFDYPTNLDRIVSRTMINYRFLLNFFFLRFAYFSNCFTELMTPKIGTCLKLIKLSVYLRKRWTENICTIEINGDTEWPRSFSVKSNYLFWIARCWISNFKYLSKGSTSSLAKNKLCHQMSSTLLSNGHFRKVIEIEIEINSRTTFT